MPSLEVCYPTSRLDRNEADCWQGRLTQLIALTESEGTWRKTLIDKSIASVAL